MSIDKKKEGKYPDWIRKEVWERSPTAVVNGKKIWEISVDGSGWNTFVDEYGNHYDKKITIKYKKRRD